MKRTWKISLAVALSAMLLCSTVDAAISSLRPPVPKDFENITATTYSEYWEMVKNLNQMEIRKIRIYSVANGEKPLPIPFHWLPQEQSLGILPFQISSD